MGAKELVELNKINIKNFKEPIESAAYFNPYKELTRKHLEYMENVIKSDNHSISANEESLNIFILTSVLYPNDPKFKLSDNLIKYLCSSANKEYDDFKTKGKALNASLYTLKKIAAKFANSEIFENEFKAEYSNTQIQESIGTMLFNGVFNYLGDTNIIETSAVDREFLNKIYNIIFANNNPKNYFNELVDDTALNPNLFEYNSYPLWEFANYKLLYPEKFREIDIPKKLLNQAIISFKTKNAKFADLALNLSIYFSDEAKFDDNGKIMLKFLGNSPIQINKKTIPVEKQFG